MLSRRREWLSITPEPERLLPRAVAVLKAGGPPSSQAVERERERVERLVLHGSRDQWLAWLREAERLAAEVDPQACSKQEATARADVLAVIANHDALMLGLPGRAPVMAARVEEKQTR